VEKVTASFLEIYGEDIYDLVPPEDAVHRRSLPVRDNARGVPHVPGLAEVEVTNRAEAMQVLRRGTMKR
jgi:hypothetical protein